MTTNEIISAVRRAIRSVADALEDLATELGAELDQDLAAGTTTLMLPGGKTIEICGPDVTVPRGLHARPGA